MADDIIANFDSLEGQEAVLAGGIMSMCAHGAPVCRPNGSKRRIRSFHFRVNTLGEEKYALLDKMDIGDILGVKGTIFRTRRGGSVLRFRISNSCPNHCGLLPEKWHGPKDVDLRYRQRYVDLIVNPEVRRVFETRSLSFKLSVKC